ncbi:serine palmitoyltransferase small subunit B [Sphaerodactylus townsendi]|uniref:serine palmitoyltransferase small subunit B n=1 Tax=Sphaerodactylus townsendi TaxID=933632 RepID=UPI002026C78F|nr:serine palmitoyltransferase small subunit B [Sphaerodactylus townsendi]XP_048362779.1 serine palmitoyltransferase small subunit B [Sphaerodactylus townsendi]XP_048362780.1 serine palmitoyltransferase small subunit B [Sphaerodactylus townsendi]XP_048362781.1 serine palmitoyltransferase small subunit B [Sphaerodactylus townsendi]XP_048362782.1 serine palmitoyltransferase small subunit B [Sphaerodactylus townsendi]
MDLKRMKDYIYWLYYQYLLISCSYVLEPWERSMFNTITITVVAMVVYTAYIFVPVHVRLAFEFFSEMFGSHPESTVSLMN